MCAGSWGGTPRAPRADECAKVRGRARRGGQRPTTRPHTNLRTSGASKRPRGTSHLVDGLGFCPGRTHDHLGNVQLPRVPLKPGWRHSTCTIMAHAVHRASASRPRAPQTHEQAGRRMRKQRRCCMRRGAVKQPLVSDRYVRSEVVGAPHELLLHRFLVVHHNLPPQKTLAGLHQ